MNKKITCTSVGVHEHALTRGRQYALIAHDETRHQVRVRGDNNRTRWYGEGYFDLDGGPVVSLVEWHFDDPVLEPYSRRDETNNYVEVSMTFDDGSERWCNLMTPNYLKDLLEPRNDPSKWGGCAEPALWGDYTIYIRDLKFETVDWTLRYMDRNNELISHTRPVGQETDEEDWDEE